MERIRPSGPVAHAYAVLGLPVDTPLPEVTRVYRRLVRDQHPDTQPSGTGHDGPERLRAVLDAYRLIRATAADAAPADTPLEQPSAPAPAGPVRSAPTTDLLAGPTRAGRIPRRPDILASTPRRSPLP